MGEQLDHLEVAGRRQLPCARVVGRGAVGNSGGVLLNALPCQRRCHLEKLHNLEALPASGFYISCFPVKVRGASAGWTRAVAIFDPVLPLQPVQGALS